MALLARSSRPANWGALAALAAGCPPPPLATSSLQQYYSSASSAAPPTASTSTSGAGGRATARPKRVTKQAFLSAAAAAASGGAVDEGTELLLRQHQQAATAHGSVGRHADTIRALRGYNYSLPALRGQVCGLSAHDARACTAYPSGHHLHACMHAQCSVQAHQHRM